MKAAGQSTVTADEAWWVTRAPTGPATLRLTLEAPEISAEAWGPGAEWALDRAPALVGLHDRPESFDPPRSLIRDLHRRRSGLRLARTERVYEAMLPAVLGQKVTTREAQRSGHRVVRRYGEPAPGPTDLWLPPEPGVLRGLSYWDLHPLGIERKRADVLLEVARRAKRLEEIMGMDRDDALARLTALRGIGPWTGGHVMGIAWGDSDAVPIGDFHLPNTVAFALAGEDRGDDDRMLDLLQPYRDIAAGSSCC